MNKTKLIIAGVMALVLIVTGILLAVNWNSIVRGVGGANLYTRDDLDAAHKQGYAEGSRGRDQLVALLEQYRDTAQSQSRQIAELNTLVSSLQIDLLTSNASLELLQIEATRLSNLVAELEGQNATLTNQVEQLMLSNLDLLLQLGQDGSTLQGLRDRIVQLESIIAALLGEVEDANTVSATFIVDGVIYDVQLGTRGQALTAFPTPQTTAHFIFNGWRVNGVLVNPATHEMSVNTTFVADVTIRYDVIFMVSGIEHHRTIVTRDQFAAVTNPASTIHRRFIGWSVNGVTTIDLAAFPIVFNTTFVALFEDSFDVIFKVQGEIHNTQLVARNAIPALPIEPTSAYWIFRGWSLDGVNIINPIQPVTAHRTFIAVYDLVTFTVTFMVNNEIATTQQVPKGKTATEPNISHIINPTAIRGWRLDGTLIMLSTKQIHANTTLVAYIAWSPVGQFQFVNQFGSLIPGRIEITQGASGYEAQMSQQVISWVFPRELLAAWVGSITVTLRITGLTHIADSSPAAFSIIGYARHGQGPMHTTLGDPRIVLNPATGEFNVRISNPYIGGWLPLTMRRV